MMCMTVVQTMVEGSAVVTKPRPPTTYLPGHNNRKMPQGLGRRGVAAFWEGP